MKSWPQFYVVLLCCLTIVVKCEEVSQSCLQCICKASSGCNLQTKCHTSGPNAYFCGPYQISWAYWADAGKPGNTGRSDDFELCLNDKNCAEVAVRGYMAKWKRDCNGDGVIDCLDFAAIHKAGASSCDQQWLYNSQYWNVFRQCQLSAGTASNNKPTIGAQPQRDPTVINVYPPAQPYPSDPWPQNSPRPQPRPTFKPIPQPVPQPDNTYSQPQPDPWNQPQPTRPVSAPQPQPQPSYPTQPAPVEPWNQPAPQPIQPNPYENAAQPRPTLKPQVQPQPDPWDQPAVDNQPYDPNVPETDPWDDVSRAVDELSRPSRNPQPSPTQPQPADPWPSNPSPVPQPIPGRAPSQPVNWNPTTERPTNSFGQPFRPVPSQPIPSNDYNPQPPSTLIEVSAVPVANTSMDESCLECICQASSDCDLNKQCEGSFCGPYLISWAYWSDAGKPGATYVTCANDKQCAEQAVHGYMNKWQTDCNGDGLIDCADFAKIHKLGPHSCSSDAIHTTDYWKSFESCKSPTIDARRLPSNPTPGEPIGRSVPQSGPSANLFLEYPNPRFINPKPVESNPVTRDVRDSRDSPVVFPSDQPQPSPIRAQPNGYGGTSPPISPINANNSSNERAFEELGLNRECMDCICHASSKCNPSIGCQNDGQGNYLCGAYQMTWAHWSDAGKPGIRGNLENLENFQSCLNNKPCSEATLYVYMKKWRRDCNEDRNINCYDFAALLRAGPTNCNAQWFLESQYWSDFRECFDFRRRK